jgi:hypothetical protein
MTKEIRTRDAYPIEQAVLVPSTSNISKHISQKAMGKRVNEVRKFLSQSFGGYTSVKGTGGWFNKDAKKLVEEDVVKVTGFATIPAYKKHKKEMKGKLYEWRKKWGQSSMGYEKEGDLFYYGVKERAKKRKLKARIRRRKK